MATEFFQLLRKCNMSHVFGKVVDDGFPKDGTS
jgi:hypothetical protein